MSDALVTTETKPGWKTTEFWVTVIVLVLNNLNTLPIPDRFQGWVNIAGLIGYQLSRGIAKNGVAAEHVVYAPGSPSVTADPTDTKGAGEAEQVAAERAETRSHRSRHAGGHD